MGFYILVILASCIFGSNFLLDNQYQRRVGSGLKVSLFHTLIGGGAGLIALIATNFFLNGMSFNFEFHPATFIIALLAALNGIVYTFCSLRALGVINLSLYSVFAMLGGMLLPSLLGFIIVDPATGARDPFTLAKAVCFACIIAALLLTVQKGESKKGKIYYIGVFILNGMSGVLNTLLKKFTYVDNETYMEGISSGYSVITAVYAIAIAAVLLLTVCRKEKNTVTLRAASFAAAGGALNRGANFMLAISIMLEGAQPSLQYPIVTGVVMIVSTLLCYFTPNKPSKRDLLSVAFALAGVVALMVIPL